MDATSLARVLKYASAFTTNEGLYSHFFFTGDGIITTDGSTLFRSDLESLPVATLSSKSVMRFLSVCPTESISWKYGPNKTSISFKSGSYNCQISNTYVTEIPSPKEVFGEPIQNLKKQKALSWEVTTEVISAIDKTLFCDVKKFDTSKQELQGVRIEREGVFTTNTYGIAAVLINTGVPVPFTLPSKLAEFIVQYGLPPTRCRLTKDYILLQYPKIFILGRRNNYPYPQAVLERILNFQSQAYIKLTGSKEEKAAVLRRLMITQGSTISISPVNQESIELSVLDLLGHKTSENITAPNSLSLSIMAGLPYFRSGYKRADMIEIDTKTLQMMFITGDFRYTILGRRG